MGEDRADSKSLSQSLDSLEEFLGHLPDHLGVRPGPLFLGGFSQGGTTSLAYAMTRPGTVEGVINLSGFLVAEEVLEVGPEGLGSLPIFWGHGTQDPAVPHALAVSGRERLREQEVALLARDYPMGHWVSPEEMEDLAEWLRGVFPGPST
jgi:phospholipase/carboxylesterase